MAKITETTLIFAGSTAQESSSDNLTLVTSCLLKSVRENALKQSTSSVDPMVFSTGICAISDVLESR